MDNRQSTLNGIQGKESIKLPVHVYIIQYAVEIQNTAHSMHS